MIIMLFRVPRTTDDITRAKLSLMMMDDGVKVNKLLLKNSLC